MIVMISPLTAAVPSAAVVVSADAAPAAVSVDAEPAGALVLATWTGAGANIDGLPLNTCQRSQSSNEEVNNTTHRIVRLFIIRFLI